MEAPVFSTIDFDKEDDPYDSGAGYIEKLTRLSSNMQETVDYFVYSVGLVTQEVEAAAEHEQAAEAFANSGAVSASAASDSATSASGSATGASGSATLASQWAYKTDGPVAGDEYSAKYWAQQAAGMVQIPAAGIVTSNGTTWGESLPAPTGAIVGTTDPQTVTRKVIKNSAYAYHDSTTTNDLDYENGSVQRWAPSTGSQTLTVSNWPASGTLGELLIEGVDLGAATIDWSGILWVKKDGTTTTTLADTGVKLQVSGVDFVLLWTRDAGTTIYGKVVR